MNDISPNTYFGLDYFDIINDQIKFLLYPKPSNEKKKIRQLNKLPNTRLFYIENPEHKIKISICEVFPQKKK
jgi:hypothetical protein